MMSPTLLSFRFAPRRSLFLWCGLALAGAAGSRSSLTAADLRPVAEESEVIALPEFSVSAAKASGYMATETTSGTRTASSILNLPYSVQVITNEFFNDFRLFDLDDQIPFVSNAAQGDKYAGGGGGTRIRGFLAPYFRNGFYRRQAPDGSSIDRVEVVKGPASAIYGRAAPGGVINYISKKPRSTPESLLSYSLGSYDNQRVEASTTGPIVPNRLFFRVDGTYYDQKRTTDFWYNRTMNLSSSVQYRLSPVSALTFEFEHVTRTMNDFQNFVRYLEAETNPATTQTLIRRGFAYYMPKETYGDLGERLARFNQSGPHRKTIRRNNSYYLTFEHKFNSVFSLRANTSYTTRWFQQDFGTTLEWSTAPNTISSALAIARYGALAAGLPGYWNGDRAYHHRTIADMQAGSQIDLTATFAVGASRHRTLLTFDVLEDDTNEDRWALSGDPLRAYMASTGYSESDINFWSRPNPYQLARYKSIPDPVFDPARFPMLDANTFNIYNTLRGGLLSHTVELFDSRLILLGTARMDYATIHRQQPLSTDPQLKDAKQSYDIFTYSTGVNYRLLGEAIVGFVSTGKSFNPAPQVDPNTGTIHGNTSAQGVELGIKGTLLDRRLAYTLVTFRTTQDNEVTDNPAWVTETDSARRETLPRYAAGARSRTKGVGLDLSGRLTDNLSLTGSMSWTDARVLENKANPSLVGTRLTSQGGFPVRSGSAGASYRFPAGGWLRGVSSGFTYLYRAPYLRVVTATTAGAFTDDLNLPGQSEWAGYLAYTHQPIASRKKLSVTYKVNVQNIFDQRVITVSGYVPTGREIAVTTTVRF
ncbi:MAG: TonB-dependent receptor plug domain-containing protein [Verrucomicrobia bacterium]|nr:TonB-dependent receptor plug domain-containing protein [Verrucomicrobiota bacterium]